MTTRGKTVAIGAIGLAVIALLLALSVMSSDPPPKFRPRRSLPPGWTVDHATAPEFVRPREALQAATPGPSTRLAAAGLRAKARTDGAFLAELARQLLDPSTPVRTREVIALVLGTIDSAEARAALVAALQGSTQSSWTLVLLHALGAEKTGEDDEVFDLPPGSPFVFEVAGLVLRIRTSIDDATARAAVARFGTDPDVAVRRAAARALVHSTEHADVRVTFLSVLGTEGDDALRAGYGHALAQWAAARSPDAERDGVVGQILAQAFRPDDAALRFRVEEPLRRAALGPAQIAALSGAAEHGTLDQQLWSLSILRSKPGTEDLFRRLLGATESKVREYAVEGLAHRPADVVVALRDPEWNVRLAGVRVLAGRAEFRNALEPMIADPNEDVREAVRKALSSAPR